jgi:glutathione S-transferase
MPQPIELYFWPTPNGYKISIALEEMALPYLIKPVNIGKGEQFKPDFLKISPNNRMPAILDPQGPDGAPISVFESGAILQYLARKSGKFYGRDERARVEVEQWLMWQMAGLGPMSGQAGHFRTYAPALVDNPIKVEYGAERYTNEVNRLYGVLDRRLEGRDFLADDYSIADIAAWPWARNHDLFGQNIDGFPNVKAWLARIAARSAVIKGVAVGEELRTPRTPEQVQKDAAALFQQTAQSVAEAAKKNA